MFYFSYIPPRLQYSYDLPLLIENWGCRKIKPDLRIFFIRIGDKFIVGAFRIIQGLYRTHLTGLVPSKKEGITFRTTAVLLFYQVFLCGTVHLNNIVIQIYYHKTIIGTFKHGLKKGFAHVKLVIGLLKVFSPLLHLGFEVFLIVSVFYMQGNSIGKIVDCCLKLSKLFRIIESHHRKAVGIFIGPEGYNIIAIIFFIGAVILLNPIDTLMEVRACTTKAKNGGSY